MSSHSCSDAPGVLRLFVYGTLKRGYWNHEAYCGSAVSIEEATVRGRLYELPSGIPVLEVPEQGILAHGSGDMLGDVALQQHIEAGLAGHPECEVEQWGQVQGELMVLPNPAETLPPIDLLEGCVSGTALTTYRRVLVPVVVAGRPTTAWCYAARGRLPVDARHLKDCRWRLSNQY